ncbi:MAG: hypothetical protein ABR591_00750 [Candidatus Velthaea sp.]
MPGIRNAALAALAVVLAGPPVTAQPLDPPVSSSVYVVVPFGEPGETDPLLANATRDLAQDLSDRQIRSALSTPVDAVEAVSDAPRMCTQFNAAGVLVSQLKFEQSKERNLTGFIPVVGGVISSSGVFDASPIRARVKLYLVDCHGKVAWKTVTTANKVHHGQNVQAGLTEIAGQAIASAVDEFSARRFQQQR